MYGVGVCTVGGWCVCVQGDNGIFRSRGLSFAVYRWPGNAAVCDAVRRTGVDRISRDRLEYYCYYYNLSKNCVVVVITVLYDDIR